ncbi:MAG: FliH/SctL family protein [Micrococcales bacterium]|nr:FliH/SctL family protein [Micrococcales bacterium]MCL2667250.1 FliH/SctL family protein [Micrococcales bacterium]
MSSSSEAFRPLAAQRAADVATRTTTKSALLSVVPAQRDQVSRPAFAAAAIRREAAASVTEARFVPLVEPEDRTSVMSSHEQARAAGFAAGFAAGSREAAKTAAAEAEAAHQRAEQAEAVRSDEHAQAMATLAGAVRAVRSARLPVLDDAQDQLYAAAVELAEAVLGVELRDAPTAARAVLARAGSAGLCGDVVVRMNPRDADVVVAPEGMRIVADPSLSHGDGVVEHGDGELDARIATALDRARTVLGRAATQSSNSEPPEGI